MDERFDQQWFTKTEESLSPVSEAIGSLHDLNTQWNSVESAIEAGSIDTKSLIEAAKVGLTHNQKDAIEELIELGRHVSYDEIVELERGLSATIASIEEQIHEVEETSREALDKLQQQLEVLCKISPQLSDSYHEAFEAEKAKIISDKLEYLQLELECARIDYDKAAALFTESGQAWPLPNLVEMSYLPKENELVTIDSFPDERALDTQRIGERVKQRHYAGRLADASTYLAYLLTEKPGHIWTSEELGEQIYDDGQTDRYSNKISALISNHRSGKIATIGNILADGRTEPLVLQRGQRHRYETLTGRMVPRSKKTVWRVVDRETAQRAQIITTISSNKQHRDTYSNWEPCTDFDVQIRVPQGFDATTQPTVQPQVEVHPNKSIETTLEISEDVPTSPEINAPTWQEEFTRSVHEAVERMKHQGLLESPTITWKLLHTKADSSIIGTEMARERAVKNKIIKRSETSADTEISLTQAILSIVQNSQPTVFQSLRRRREAKAIVENIVSGYLKSHNINITE